ncbi:hypothetical protein KUG88_29335, partial [Rhodococcus rhodochrous]|uniref:hypothetical protein n=1 Tax=Rhodococcus rhodochrous TaxID=1829 RepID=UPI001E2AFA48
STTATASPADSTADTNNCGNNTPRRPLRRLERLETGVRTLPEPGAVTLPNRGPSCSDFACVTYQTPPDRGTPTSLVAKKVTGREQILQDRSVNTRI